MAETGGIRMSDPTHAAPAMPPRPPLLPQAVLLLGRVLLIRLLGERLVLHTPAEQPDQLVGVRHAPCPGDTLDVQFHTAVRRNHDLDALLPQSSPTQASPN